MNVQDVINRASTDEEFAERLKSQALAAVNTKPGSEEWGELLANFAKDPSDLARLNPSTVALKSPWTTLTTTTTTTTFGCGFTTTTTTTTNFCPDEL